MWSGKLLQIFKIRDLRKKIFFVLLIFIVFRMMANIPAPGVNTENLKEFFQRFQVFGLMNIFAGGAMENVSIAMLGLGPYITATIIFQLLTLIFPALERMYKEEGDAGRKKFNQYARIVTVPLALVQAYAMLSFFQKQNAVSFDSSFSLLASVVAVTAGSIFLMWLGELITTRGIGNGVSLLIFAGIVARLPLNIWEIMVKWERSQIPFYALFLASIFAIIFGVVFVTEARRNIPVSYAKRVRGSKIYGGVSTYLPMSVNPAGVIPIIFALSIMIFPGMIANFLTGAGGKVGLVAQAIANFFDPQKHPFGHGAMYFALVFIFTYFYTMVTFDPKTISSNLQKMGGFVPGIRPGTSTVQHLSFILHRVLFIGALFLAAIAVMPSIIQGITRITALQFLIGGTSVLIMVSVILEMVKQINSQLQMREYETI